MHKRTVHFRAISIIKARMADRSTALLAYVRFVMEQRHLTPSGLAKLAGVSSSTLTRALNNPDHKFNLSMTTLEKIESVTGYSYLPYLNAENVPGLAVPVNQLSFSGDFDLNDAIAPLVPVIKGLCAGVWHDRDVPTYGEIFYVPLLITRVDKEKLIAFQVKGASCHDLAVDGEILLCEKLNDGFAVTGESFVVVERYKEQGKLIELTARKVSLKGDLATYTLPTSETAFGDQKVEATLGDVAEIKPIALVRFVIRRPPSPYRA